MRPATSDATWPWVTGCAPRGPNSVRLAEAERGDVQAALHALRAAGIRPGSNDERRERWLKLRLSHIDDALATEL